MIDYDKLQLNKTYYFITNDMQVSNATPMIKKEQIIPGENYCSHIDITYYDWEQSPINRTRLYETKKEATNALIEMLKKDIEDD